MDSAAFPKPVVLKWLRVWTPGSLGLGSNPASSPAGFSESEFLHLLSEDFTLPCGRAMGVGKGGNLCQAFSK